MAKYAITDIHGCLQTLQALLENTIEISDKDELYFLGDYINKGPDSKGVLDYLMSLSSRVRCRFLRGNHDQELVEVYHSGNTGDSWLSNYQRANTLLSFEAQSPLDIPIKYIDFIDHMHWFLEFENYYLVHAGFDFTLSNPFSDKDILLNIKNWVYDAGKAKGKKIIHGHIPKTTKDLMKSIRKNSSVLDLDTGCVYRNNVEYGVLSALNLDTLEVVFQKNIEKEYEIEVKST